MASVKADELYGKGYQIDLGDGRLLLKRDKPIYTPLATKDRTHIVKDGEKPWMLGFKYLGDDRKWFNIMDANKVFNPFELTIGSELVVPDLDVVKVGQ